MRAKEFVKEDVVDFPSGAQRFATNVRKNMSDEEKYAQALADQNPEHRPGVGVEPCPFCSDVYCDYDCDESQADGFNDPKHDLDVAHDMEKMGGPYDDDVNTEGLDRVLKNAGIYKGSIDEYTTSPAKAIVEPWIIISDDGNHIYPNLDMPRGFAQEEAEKTAADLTGSRAVPLKQALEYLHPGAAYDSAKSFLQDYMDSTFAENVEEGNLKNANALVGSGLADPSGKKTNPDSKAHKSVRTPTTTYSKDRKRYNNGAPPGANDGFVGG